MLNLSRRSCVRSVLFGLLLSTAAPAVFAQAAPSQHPGLDRQLERFDIGIVASAIINKDSNGTAIVNGEPGSSNPEPQPTTVNLHPGTTVGLVIPLRYTVKPWVGFELNYGYSRYTDTFNPFGFAGSGPIGVQQNASEYTAGYVVHLVNHPIFGATPVFSVGAGTTAFRPTPGGGQGLINQARATYYYSVGAEKLITPHFGLRGMFRETFFKAPDFGTNYLTIQQQTTSLEPSFGFFLKY